MRHYLIGRQYDSERAAYWYSVEHTENAEPMSRTTLRRLISGRIAQENNVSQGTVEKYSRYSRAIDRRTYFSFCLFSTHILKSSVSVCVSFFSAFCSDKRAVPLFHSASSLMIPELLSFVYRKLLTRSENSIIRKPFKTANTYKAEKSLSRISVCCS